LVCLRKHQITAHLPRLVFQVKVSRVRETDRKSSRQSENRVQMPSQDNLFTYSLPKESQAVKSHNFFSQSLVLDCKKLIFAMSWCLWRCSQANQNTMDEFIEVDLPCYGKQFLRTKRINEISKQFLLSCSRHWADAYGFAHIC